MTVTKAHLIDSVHERVGLSRSKSTKVFESMLEIVKHTLAGGEDLLISGFGKFCVRDKKPRRGRNPQTGEDLMLDSRRVVTFGCSPVLRDKMNLKP